MGRRLTSTALATAMVASIAVTSGGTAVAETEQTSGACVTPSEEMTFATDYIDTARAGGEPIVTTHPDGGLLWGSHAGTTHFYSPAAGDTQTSAFLENYEGQTYQYRSDDQGESWNFIDREPVSTLDPVSGLPNSGFSDPEFAIDLAGNVYISEINLANIAVSKSSDGGRTYTLQSLAEITASDRQWMEADEEDVLYFVANTFGGGSVSSGKPVTGRLGHDLYKSIDGGVTFSEPQNLGGQQSSDIEIDKRDGRLYELHSNGSRLELWIAPDARDQETPGIEFLNVDPSTNEVIDTQAPRPFLPPVIAENYDRKSTIGPTLDIDANGNLFVVWDDDGGAGRDRGVYVTFSTDRGLTWSEAVQVDDALETGGVAFWPWIAAGSEGAVISWLQHDEPMKDNEPQNAEGDWYVKTSLVRACDTDGDGDIDTVAAPTAPVRTMSEPVHQNTICTGGTTCQAMAIDRRLGDYFANAIDRDGNVYISVADTMSGGGVGLPRVIRQTGGPTVGDPYADAALWPAYPKPSTSDGGAGFFGTLAGRVASFLGLGG